MNYKKELEIGKFNKFNNGKADEIDDNLKFNVLSLINDFMKAYKEMRITLQKNNIVQLANLLKDLKYIPVLNELNNLTFFCECIDIIKRYADQELADCTCFVIGLFIEDSNEYLNMIRMANGYNAFLIVLKSSKVSMYAKRYCLYILMRFLQENYEEEKFKNFDFSILKNIIDLCTKNKDIQCLKELIKFIKIYSQHKMNDSTSFYCIRLLPSALSSNDIEIKKNIASILSNLIKESKFDIDFFLQSNLCAFVEQYMFIYQYDLFSFYIEIRYKFPNVVINIPICKFFDNIYYSDDFEASIRSCYILHNLIRIDNQLIHYQEIKNLPTWILNNFEQFSLGQKRISLTFLCEMIRIYPSIILSLNNIDFFLTCVYELINDFNTLEGFKTILLSMISILDIVQSPEHTEMLLEFVNSECIKKLYQYVFMLEPNDKIFNDTCTLFISKFSHFLDES